MTTGSFPSLILCVIATSVWSSLQMIQTLIGQHHPLCSLTAILRLGDESYQLRFVDVIWFVFLVLQLLLIRLDIHNETCCISKSMMKH